MAKAAIDDPILEDRRLVLVSMSRRDGETWLALMRRLNRDRCAHRVDLLTRADQADR